MNPLSSTDYSYGQRLLRLCTFQSSIYSNEYPGWFEKAIHYLYLMCAEWTLTPELFDARRAERSYDAFERLGATIEHVSSRSGASIQTITFKADVFQSKLEALGAEWKSIDLEDRQQFIIIPPTQESGDWKRFEADMLSRFRWKKTSENVIVTGESSTQIDLSSPHLFLHVNSASTVSCMLGERIGIWLGLKQHAVVYNPSGTAGSTGTPSEGAYYCDADAVLSHSLNSLSISLNKVWVTSACGGSCPAAYLKQKYHSEGINLITESGYANLDEDFFSNQSFLASWFAHRYYDGIKSLRQLGPTETGFRIEGLWKGLEKSATGRVVVVYPENDQYIPTPQTPNKLLALAQKVTEQASTISFVSGQPNAHRDRFYRYPEARDRVLKAVFTQ